MGSYIKILEHKHVHDWSPPVNDTAPYAGRFKLDFRIRALDGLRLASVAPFP
jgi:hypothetical protein